MALIERTTPVDPRKNQLAFTWASMRPKSIYIGRHRALYRWTDDLMLRINYKPKRYRDGDA